MDSRSGEDILTQVCEPLNQPMRYHLFDYVRTNFSMIKMTIFLLIWKKHDFNDNFPLDLEETRFKYDQGENFPFDLEETLFLYDRTDNFPLIWKKHAYVATLYRCTMFSLHRTSNSSNVCAHILS